MSYRRAEALASIMPRLADAVGAVVGNPRVPLLAAVSQFRIPDGDTGIQSLGEIPEEYDNLAILTTLIADDEPLGNQPILLPEADAVLFAENLFATLCAGHRLAATFSRNSGCCMRGPFVTPLGDLTDVYFLTAGEDLTASTLEEGQIKDLANAVDLLSEAISQIDALHAALRAAISVYNVAHAPPSLLNLADNILCSHDIHIFLLATAMYKAFRGA